MTYGEAKKRVLQLMDEVNPKADLTEKLPLFFDMGQKEVARYYPIWRTAVYTEDTPRALPADCWEPGEIVVDGRVLALWDRMAKFDGLPEAFDLHYKAWPAAVTEGTEEGTEMDTPEEAMLAVLYFVAAKCQEMEYDQRYFQNFFSEYQGQLANLAALAQGVAVVEPPEWTI